MKKLLAAVIAGLFAVSGAAIAADMKKEEKKAEAKKEEKKAEAKKEEKKDAKK
jgi:ribosomal protein L12E/L44/L45/RPP1/RPP2